MAPLNSTPVVASGPRKRMVQPVLPALPLVPKAKRLESRSEEGKVTLGDAATDDLQLTVVSASGQFTGASGGGDADPAIEELDNTEQLTSSFALVAHDTASSQESLRTVKPVVDIEIEQVQDADLHQEISTVLPEADARGVSFVAERIYTPQVDASMTYTNGHQEEEPGESTTTHVSQKSPTPFADVVLPVHDPIGYRTHIEPSEHTVIPATLHSAVLPIAERSVKQDYVFDTSNHAIPEAITNGHVSPIYPSGLHYHSLSVPSPARTPQVPTIHEHLLHLANSKQWADWVIEINQPGPNLQPFIGYAHSFVLLRSEKLRKIIARPQDPAFASNVVSLYPSRSIQPHAFEAALRFFYSDTVLSAEALFPRDTYMDKHARAHVVDYTLSYWMAGIELGLEPVSTRAFNLLAGLVDWDIAELLTKEVMAIRASVPPVPDVEPPSESIIMADSILRQVLRLFTHRLDLAQFRLDIEAQADLLVSRFAQLDQGRPTSNPALASMVFGSMPSSGNHSPSTPYDTTSSSSADTVASIILLNLDFADLCVLTRELIGFHGDAGFRIISEVISERERRRLLIVGNRGIPNKQRMANSSMWDNLGLREYVDDGKLRRERVGYLIPHKRH